jgi:hypothetical protein
MKPNTYKILIDAVERGVQYGWNRAHKHTDAPEPHEVRSQIETSVMSEICEYFTFPENENQ